MSDHESAQVAPSKKSPQTVKDWVSIGEKEKWLKDMKRNLSLVASIIATMTFQIALNPPGGVFSVDIDGNLNATINNSTGRNQTIYPGQAVLAAVDSHAYRQFLVSNTICFIASLSVCLLLVSGFPLQNRFPMWILSIGMFITVISLSLTYLFAAGMVTPSPVWGGKLFDPFGIVILVWIVLMGTFGFVIVNVMRLSFWIEKKCNETNK